MKTYIDKINSNRKGILLVILVLILGIVLGRITGTHPHTELIVDGNGTTSEATIWTCSMHPQIRQDTPGICPLCGMDLTPLEEEEASDLPADALRMSATAMELAQVHTAPVTLGNTEKEIALAGKVTLDPNYAFSQSAHVSGRVEEMYVNTVGEYVQKGQKIANLYAPDLINTQKELLQAYQNRALYPAVFEAVKEKMQLWKISTQQIEAILKQGTPIQNFPIYANHSGYLVEKNIEAGDYVESGTVLFKISQLDKLWIYFDVFENDASFVRKGMEVQYQLPAMPGKEFKGKLDFVAPILNPETRTLMVRLNIQNADLKFKPEMLVNGLLKSAVSLGTDKIVVPKSAVMWTGKHSVVYVKYATDQHVGFQMRPVVLGGSLGDRYVIEEGLEVGEEIVVEGTFSVDAAAQLANKPSMMNHVHPASQRLHFVKADLNATQQKIFASVMEPYFKMKDALVQDDVSEAVVHYKQLIQTWQSTDWNKMPQENQASMEQASTKEALQEKGAVTSTEIETVRDGFNELSRIFIEMFEAYGSPMGAIYLQHCPMVSDNQGADWLSKEAKVLNPYFGASMLTCGDVTKKME